MKCLAAIALALSMGFGTAQAAPLSATTNDPTVELTVKIGTGDDAAVSSGSGVHIGDGIIITAAHVVNDAIDADAKGQYQKITVTFDDAGNAGKTVAATVLWAEPKEDIAAIKIDAVPDDLGIASFDPADAMASACGHGDCGEIEAVGQPFGLDFIHTFGHVSGTLQDVGDPWPHAVPIDVRIGPGSSGGPVYRRGTHEVEGIVVGTISEFMPIQIGHYKEKVSKFPSGVNIMVASSEVVKLLTKHHTHIVAETVRD